VLGLSGCMRVDVNPEPIFEQVKEGVANPTDKEIYWAVSVKDCVEVVSVNELLQKDFSEEMVVRIALLNNQSLQALYEDLGIAKASHAQAKFLKNPIFTLAYQFSTQSAVSDLINFGLLENFLEIFLLPMKNRVATAELAEIKCRLVTNVLDVVGETTIAFYALQKAMRICELKKQVLLANELSYEAAQRLFIAGNLRDLEVSLEKSFYEQSKLEVASWEIKVLKKREELNVLMGLRGEQIDWKITSEIPELIEEENAFETIENDAILNSIDLKVAYNNLIATAISFGIDTTKLVFPLLEMGAAIHREESVWYVGPAINLAIPLFDVDKANSKRAESVIMKEWKQYTTLATEIRSKARRARFSLLNNLKQSQYFKNVILPLSKEITHLVHMQNNAMQIGVFRLLAAKKRELEHQIQSIQMQTEYRISKVILETLLRGHVLGKDVLQKREK